jgi:hypothetical protein
MRFGTPHQTPELKSLFVEADVDAAGVIGVLTAGVVVVVAMIAVASGGRIFEFHL